jgi:hypothetical protein
MLDLGGSDLIFVFGLKEQQQQRPPWSEF